eukprot:CAMPEP_0177761822 /NCGR_PEP_ID=MMETSP0491_2-20121128/6012_1 /TAXON_ID=63592 /ORGANISM="Tetraselmis chuii, Strain PLY429" /LENGTH=40 /DNA_ID= /DNA_START= /DNA_END= /DNA_ORIENTATION=
MTSAMAISAPEAVAPSLAWVCADPSRRADSHSASEYVFPP